jgi:mono/diheme cytochrome c family protein
MNTTARGIWRLLALLLTVTLLLLGCGEAENDAEPTAMPTVTPALAPPAVPSEVQFVRLGEDLYVRYCAHCHQRDGGGMAGTYPPLDGNGFVVGHDPVQLVSLILHGQGRMPAFHDALPDDDIATVASYIRDAWTNAAPRVTTAQVREAHDVLPDPSLHKDHDHDDRDDRDDR